jgi:hypothetical protein
MPLEEAVVGKRIYSPTDFYTGIVSVRIRERRPKKTFFNILFASGKLKIFLKRKLGKNEKHEDLIGVSV